MPTSLARHARTIGALLLTVAYSTDVVWADEIDQCMTNLQAAYESPQQFTQEGEITCPAGMSLASRRVFVATTGAAR